MQSIFNYVPIHAHLSTSGQLNADELKRIKEQGFSTVINLAVTALNDSENESEDQICLALGIDYIHIPLSYEQPSTSAGLLILDLIDHLVQEQKIWVHCSTNKCVASLMYLYRQFFMGLDIVEADQYLEQIWQPDDTWTGYIHALRLQLQARQSTRDIQKIS